MQRLTYCLIASLAALFGVPPALAQHANKTELVTFDGASVDRIQMRETIDAAWVIDTQNILYRDAEAGVQAPCPAAAFLLRAFRFTRASCNTNL